ncbi:MAG: FHIPEP family type III secretion protein [Candidatus Sericytochromatia bacterium]|nr:FHIPEP family type III secretion protein [Candidatus Sericytochromatia bacterium]
MVDREKALNLLVGRYRYEDAMRLFAEYCLLLEEDWDDYVARHDPARLRLIHRQLLAVGLWPAELVPPPGGSGLLDGAKRAITGLLGGLRSSRDQALVPPPGTQSLVTSGEASAEIFIGRVPEMVLQSLVSPPLALEMHPGLVQALSAAESHSLIQDLIGRARYQLAHELGFAFPAVTVVQNPAMPQEIYALRIQGETLAEGRLVPGCVAALGPELPPAWASEPHPVRPIPMVWIAQAASNAWAGEVSSAEELLAEHLASLVRRHAHRLFTNHELDQVLRVREVEIGRETLQELLGRFMSVSELRLVLQSLLRQGYSIRQLPQMVEILMNHFINYLADKPLSMDETWKISSHIPFFSTDELVQAVLHGLGLPRTTERIAGIQASLERSLRLDPVQSPATRPLGSTHLDAPVFRQDSLEREPRLPFDTEEGAR